MEEAAGEEEQQQNPENFNYGSMDEEEGEQQNPENFIELCLAWFEFNQSNFQMKLKQWGRDEGVLFPMSFLELALQTPKHFTSWQILLFVYICGFYGNGNIPGSLECEQKGYLKSYYLPSRLEKKFIKFMPQTIQKGGYLLLQANLTVLRVIIFLT